MCNPVDHENRGDSMTGLSLQVTDKQTISQSVDSIITQMCNPSEGGSHLFTKNCSDILEQTWHQFEQLHQAAKGNYEKTAYM